MPIYSGGGGGSGLPAHWTANSHGAVIAQTDNGSKVLLSKGPLAGDDLLRLENTDGHGVVMQFEPFGSLLLYPDLANVNAIFVQPNQAMTGPLIDVETFDASSYFQLDKACRPVVAVHSAPADADVNAGECYQWFDQTNGAAKAMFKGKTANGTVVAASVAMA